jgi:thiol-disulfide isomerase/thioredoxin
MLPSQPSHPPVSRRRPQQAAGRLFLLAVALMGSPSGVATDAAAAATAPQPNAQRAAYYRRAMPDAATFRVHPIAADMLDPVDRGNEDYIEARDRHGRTVGYLRDFTGPVSPAAECPCNPLSLTLVFEADTTLRTLLSPQPLQKYGHAPMSADEVTRLVTILRDPPPALRQVERVEDMVDITTGATQHALKDDVVPQAALSTRRLVGLVMQTQRILQGAPGDRAQGRLNALVRRYRGVPGPLAKQLAAWLAQPPGVGETAELRREVWRTLGRAYEEACQNGWHAHADVVAQLFGPRTLKQIDPTDMAHVALRMSRLPGAKTLLAQAASTLSAAPAGALPAPLLAQVRGTASLLAGDATAALPELQQAAAAQTLDAAPQLHAHLAEAYAQLGDSPRACGLAQALYRHHPRLPGAEAKLATCFATTAAGGASVAPRQALAQALRQEEQARFLSTLVTGDVAMPSPTLTLKDPRGREVAFDPTDPDRLTILVFFATWCPHCRAELPQIRSFIAGLNATRRKQVRVIGVRTAKERETMPYSTFIQSFTPNFPIYVDCTMSGAFAHFAQTHDLSMTLPTTVVLDQAGRLRAKIAPGDFRDIAQELRWAVDSLLQLGPRASMAPTHSAG